MALLRLAELSAVSATVADGALVRSLRGALALVRALRAGLPGTPDTGPLTAAHHPPHAAGATDRDAPAHGDPTGPAALSLAA
ncbi:hypothetical protein SALBM311S_10256 [Streptomyces alboniger]